VLDVRRVSPRCRGLKNDPLFPVAEIGLGEFLRAVHLVFSDTTRRAGFARLTRSLGWEEILRRRKAPAEEKRANVTIGEFIEAVAAKSLFSPKTFQSYAQALRKIAGDINGETKREKRDAIKLRAITPEKIDAWRIEFIRRKATDPLREKSARISVGSFILRARALFSAETVARVRNLVELPEPMPFAGIKVETVHGPRYRATFDMVELLESARAELAAKHPSNTRSSFSARLPACGATKSTCYPGAHSNGTMA
jgi:hypothetical protein